MGGDLDQAGLRDQADLVPVQEAAARFQAAAEVDRLVGGRVHPGAHRRQQRRPAVGLQDRQHAGVEAAVTVVERQQHGALGQRFAALARGQDLVDRDGLVAVLAQPGELVDEAIGAHAQEGLVGVVVLDVVVCQGQEIPGDPGFFGGRHGPFGRRRVDRDVLGAGGQRQDGQQQQGRQQESGG